MAQQVVTYEGVVENGCVHLPEDAVLPEKTQVYVMVPEAIVEMEKPPQVVHVRRALGQKTDCSPPYLI